MMDRLASAIDRALILDLSKEMIRAASPTGAERACAEVLCRAMKDIGLEARLQPLYDDRANAIGVLRGSAQGPTVLLGGHLDTSVRGDEPWLTAPGFKNEPIIDGDWIYGNGIQNMKASFVAYLAALKAMAAVGIQLPGDVLIAGTVGEIELAAVDEFQGKEYDGYGLGTRHLLLHGYPADFHVLGEPSSLVPLIGMMGAIWAKVTVVGAFSHTAFSGRHVNAIEEMWRLSSRLERWISAYCDQNEFMGVRPQVNRAAIRGGLPWRAARTPATCSLYVDVRFPPHRYPIDVCREFASEVAAAASDLAEPPTVEFYVTRPGTLLPPTHALVRAIADSHMSVTQENSEPQFAAPFCTDAIDSNRYGVPTVVYGPGGRVRLPDDDTPGRTDEDPRVRDGEYVHVDDIVTAARVYAATLIRLSEMNVAEVRHARGDMPGVAAAD